LRVNRQFSDNMIIAKTWTKHIFCLEGDWTDDLRSKNSIKAALDFLHDNSKIRYIHRHASTKEEIANRLLEYNKKKYSDYTICYLAFHGEPNKIKVGRELMTLDELAEISQGLLKNKIVHFGSCSSLRLNKRYIERFLKKTNALCVSGYKLDFSFVPGTVLDLLFFEMCQRYKNITCIERDMRFYYGKLMRELEFSMAYITPSGKVHVTAPGQRVNGTGFVPAGS
jgi:hypothetical protein